MVEISAIKVLMLDLIITAISHRQAVEWNLCRVYPKITSKPSKQVS